jgi:hypothetical protein
MTPQTITRHILLAEDKAADEVLVVETSVAGGGA